MVSFFDIARRALALNTTNPVAGLWNTYMTPGHSGTLYPKGELGYADDLAPVRTIGRTDRPRFCKRQVGGERPESVVLARRELGK